MLAAHTNNSVSASCGVSLPTSHTQDRSIGGANSSLRQSLDKTGRSTHLKKKRQQTCAQLAKLDHSAHTASGSTSKESRAAEVTVPVGSSNVHVSAMPAREVLHTAPRKRKLLSSHVVSSNANGEQEHGQAVASAKR